MTENWGKRDTSQEKKKHSLVKIFVFEVDFGEMFILI